MNKLLNQLNKKVTSVRQTLHTCIHNDAGDFYISEGVKVIIAVVIGALLLAAITLLFNSTIIPRITTEIQSLFG